MSLISYAAINWFSFCASNSNIMVLAHNSIHNSETWYLLFSLDLRRGSVLLILYYNCIGQTDCACPWAIEWQSLCVFENKIIIRDQIVSLGTTSHLCGLSIIWLCNCSPFETPTNPIAIVQVCVRSFQYEHWPICPIIYRRYRMPIVHVTFIFAIIRSESITYIN